MVNYIEKGDALIIIHSKFGFVRAWARQDYEPLAGGSASFGVNVNSDSMPGITEMTVNTNQWDVYKIDDPALLQLLLNEYVPLWVSR